MHRRVHRWMAAGAAVLATVPLTACGRDDDAGPATKGMAGPSAGPSGAGVPADPANSAGLSATSAPAGALPHACTLLTADEIKRLTGMTSKQLTTPEPAGTNELTSCVWDLSPGGAVYLTVLRTSADAFRSGHSATRVVSGVGDAAYYDAYHLFVLDGTVSLDIIVRTGESEEALLEREKQVALVVMPKV